MFMASPYFVSASPYLCHKSTDIGYSSVAFLYSSRLEGGKHYTVEWKNVSSSELIYDVGNITDRRFVLDVKPIQDEKGGVSAFDVRWDWDRTVSQFVEFQANTVAYLSTKSADSSNSVSIRLGVAYNLSDKYYVPLGANAKLESSEDFSRKDYSVDLGLSFSIEAMRLSLSGLAREFTGNTVDAAPEPRIYLYGEYIFRQSLASGVADVNIKRLNGQAFWSVPIQTKQYLNLSAKIWLEEKTRPRSFVEASYEYRVNDELSLLLKWINGELPPYFQKQANVSAGFSFKINKK